MKAYIICDSPLGSDYSGTARYIVATEDKNIYSRWCTNRAFANHDLTIGVESMLKDNDVTEVFSNGVIVWSDGQMTEDANADFRSANYEYERINSDAR